MYLEQKWSFWSVSRNPNQFLVNECFWVKSRARIDDSNMSRDMTYEINAYLIRVYYIDHLNFNVSNFSHSFPSNGWKAHKILGNIHISNFLAVLTLTAALASLVILASSRSSLSVLSYTLTLIIWSLLVVGMYNAPFLWKPSAPNSIFIDFDVST